MRVIDIPAAPDMRRAAAELGYDLPGQVSVLRDAVPSPLPLRRLFLEYNKFLASQLLRLWNAVA